MPRHLSWRWVTVTLLASLALRAGGTEYVWQTNDIDYPSDEMRLQGDVMWDITNTSLVAQCAAECLKHDDCRSFNFIRERRLCELSNSTHADSGARLQSDPLSSYFTRDTFDVQQNALGMCVTQRPCANLGKCYHALTLEGVNTYYCVCVAGWEGRQCTEEAGSLTWADWGEWSTCSKSCGRGWQARRRECVNSKTDDVKTALDCFGSSQEQRYCNDVPCPYWFPWSGWGECSTYTTCGRGYKLRTRKCGNGGTAGIDRLCKGPTNETAPCKVPGCEVPLKIDGGPTEGEGRVLIYDDLRETWGAVCGAQWKKSAADVACRQLGYTSGAAEATTDDRYGGENDSYALSSVECSGRERHLAACLSKHWGESCDGDAPAGVHCVVDGGWNTWTEWGECSVTCEDGLRRRTRVCDYPPPLRGGKFCSDVDSQTKPCTMRSCPVDGEWNAWAEWEQCNVTCGGGRQRRARTCVQPLHGGAVCPGSDVDWQTCNTHPCPIDGYWEAWSEWRDCNVTCGGGWRMRNRTCEPPLYGGADCDGSALDWSECNTHHCPIDGIWGNWTEWEQCNVTCGGGWQLRTRVCDDPKYGGAPCPGSDEDRQICNDFPCPIDGDWSSWAEWRQCNVSCGGGWQKRNRTCNLPLYGGALCPGSDEDGKECGMYPCPIDGAWGNWTDWEQCNVTCGGGWQLRTRVCDDPKYGGAPCPDSDEDRQICNNFNCPVDGEWNQWLEWSACSVTCADGTRNRTRICQRPAYGGMTCPGNNSEVEACNPRPCPIDGVWATWQQWGECSTTCGNGTHDRHRDCVEPKYGGEPCPGNDTDTERCIPRECPVDGVWDSWNTWGECTLTCGGGEQTRNRTCQDPLYGGRQCVGLYSETQACNEDNCPEDGFWFPWIEWDTCTTTCGGGTQQRSRVCRVGKFGGENCTGDRWQERACNQQSCPNDGVWEDWTDWFSCNVTCGGGSQTRTRVCNQPKYGGSECQGVDAQWQNCSDNPCPIDGVASPWTEWGDCSEWCGDGVQNRSRECIGPFYGGAECLGPLWEQQECFLKHCPIAGMWNDWQSWGNCSEWCGTGLQIRNRTCHGPFYAGAECAGQSGDVRECFLIHCPIAGVWRPWTRWSNCSELCGDGLRTRNRTCIGPFYGGDECGGDWDQVQDCFLRHCPIDGVWTAWAEWGACSESCNNGTQNRTRQCVGPYYGGSECPGEAEQVQGCFLKHCPIDGVWEIWTAWSECSVTCATGSQYRTRTCHGPFYEGLQCDGKSRDDQDCFDRFCPVDGVWELWSDWGACSTSCGDGRHGRNRTCEGPFYGGSECAGDWDQERDCFLIECPIDGVWNAWTDWGECSVTCATGIHYRTRNCDGPYHAGLECPGAAKDEEECFDRHCPVDGVWNAWSEWGECDVTCGGGIHNRQRVCEEPLYGGAECPGSTDSSEICNANPCPIPGDWMPWTAWSVCSVTCGGGIRQRSRECDMDSYGNLTAPCLGPNSGNTTCHEYSCLPLAHSCSDLVEKGLRDNASIVEINPDSSGYQKSFWVTCDLFSNDGIGVTSIHHNFESETMVKGYEGMGEYKGILVYRDSHGNTLTVNQLANLVDVSSQCHQHISWKCKSTVFNSPDSELSRYRLTYWHNRKDTKMSYWGGAQERGDVDNYMVCACWETRSCADSTKRCNCDKNDQTWRLDEGDLTFKPDLPVKQFSAGDTGLDNENGIFTIGPLKCGGFNTTRLDSR